MDSQGYDSSIYDRRTEVVDNQQRKHLRVADWMDPGNCTCRGKNGRYFFVCVNANCSNEGRTCGSYCEACFERHSENVRFLNDVPTIDYHYLSHQQEWSEKTFGPGSHILGVTDHISKELVEVIESDGALDEWADVVILALDGATRAAVAQGGSVADALKAIAAKQEKNESRRWPDWRTAEPGKAIEHIRD